MNKQRFTSAETSINKTKLPRIYRYDLPAGAVVVDYGCGRYVDHLQKEAARRGYTWFGYDLFNRTEEENRAAVQIMKDAAADYVICSNVLNVIDADAVIDGIIAEAVHAAREAAIFTVYEGDGTGHGRQTGPDQYQRNEKRAAYVDRIKALGYDCRRHGEYIIVTQ